MVDPRRSEWQEVDRPDGSTDVICPSCLTDDDFGVALDDHKND